MNAGKSPYLPPTQSSAAAAAAMLGDEGGLFWNSHLTEPLDSEVRSLMMAREREKMKIREEILQGALLRRRELEAEVISELMMETDELKRRRIAAAGEGLSMPEVKAAPLSSKREMFGLAAAGEVPFQRQPGAATAFASAAAKPEGSSKGYVISLAKPTTHMATTVAPAKRKFETPITKGADNNSLSADNNTNRNQNVEYKCRLCQVTATCARGLVEHLNGKKHKSKKHAGRTHRANLLKNGGGLITIKRKPKNARFGGDGNKMRGEIEGKVTDAAEQKKVMMLMRKGSSDGSVVNGSA